MNVNAYNIHNSSTLMDLNSSVITSTNGTLMDSERPHARSFREFTEYKIALHLAKYFLPAIVFLGTLGNLLTFVVLIRKRMRKTSVNTYLLLLACADTGALYCSGFKTWLRLISGFELLHVSNFGCKFFIFLFLISLHMSAWLVVAISSDRFFAVWFPLRSLTMCSVRRARIVSLIGFIMISIYNGHVFWTMHLVNHRCSADPKNVFMMVYYPWIKLTTYSCLPFTLVLILNICICVKIIPGFRHLPMKQSGNCESRTFHSAGHNDAKVTTMLVIVSVTWLFLTAPFTLWTFVARQRSDPGEIAADFLAKTVCFMLMYVNHGVNFYLYCITGKKFRKELREMFGTVGKKSDKNMKTSFLTTRSSIGRSTTMNSENITLCSPSQRSEPRGNIHTRTLADTYN